MTDIYQRALLAAEAKAVRDEVAEDQRRRSAVVELVTVAQQLESEWDFRFDRSTLYADVASANPEERRMLGRVVDRVFEGTDRPPRPALWFEVRPVPVTHRGSGNVTKARPAEGSRIAVLTAAGQTASPATFRSFEGLGYIIGNRALWDPDEDSRWHPSNQSWLFDAVVFDEVEGTVPRGTVVQQPRLASQTPAHPAEQTLAAIRVRVDELIDVAWTTAGPEGVKSVLDLYRDGETWDTPDADPLHSDRGGPAEPGDWFVLRVGNGAWGIRCESRAGAIASIEEDARDALVGEGDGRRPVVIIEVVG